MAAGEAKAAQQEFAADQALKQQQVQNQASMQRLSMQQAHNTQMAEFNAYMRNTEMQTKQAWELEKWERNKNFQLESQHQAIKTRYDMAVQDQVLQEKEIQSKLSQIDREAKTGRWSAIEVQKLRDMVQFGYSPKIDPDEVMAKQMAKTMGSQEGGQPVEAAIGTPEFFPSPEFSMGPVQDRHVTFIKQIAPGLPEIEQKQVRSVMTAGEPNAIEEVYRRLIDMEKQKIEAGKQVIKVISAKTALEEERKATQKSFDDFGLGSYY